MELMTYASVDGEKLALGAQVRGRSCSVLGCKMGSWTPGRGEQRPGAQRLRLPILPAGEAPRLARRPLRPRGLRRGRIARAGEPGAAQEFGSGGEHFLRAGRRGPGGRGGGQTLRCAPPAGSMRPLLCALAGLALLRAAGEWGRAGRAGGGTEPEGEQRAGEEGRARAGVGGY